MTEEKKERYELVSIPTQTEVLIRDTKDKNEETRDYTMQDALLKILNGLEELKKGLM